MSSCLPIGGHVSSGGDFWFLGTGRFEADSKRKKGTDKKGTEKKN